MDQLLAIIIGAGLVFGILHYFVMIARFRTTWLSTLFALVRIEEWTGTLPKSSQPLPRVIAGRYNEVPATIQHGRFGLSYTITLRSTTHNNPQPQTTTALRSLGMKHLKIRADSIVARFGTDFNPGNLRDILKALSHFLDLALINQSRLDQSQTGDLVKVEALDNQFSAVNCPFCRDSIQFDLDHVAQCQSCSTIHHEACFQEARGCTVYACQSNTKLKQRPTRG